MSYLNPLRLHFAGSFVAAPSTVNNDVTHYNNATFRPEFQLPQDATGDNGWWNPAGDNRFTVDCLVMSAQYLDGTAAVAATEPALTFRTRSIGGPPGKIVDLDPQQQMVSMIFGMDLAITPAAGGTPLLRGKFAPAPFTDIWQRGTTGRGDERAGAMFQSVLESLQWGNVASSRLLTELKASATSGLLSVKFNLDGYSMDPTTPGFTNGRVVGTIGPATSAEPRHFTVGRHFSKVAFTDASPFPFPSIRPRRGINYCVAVVDEVNKKIHLDLGNAVSTNPSAGDASDLGVLTLVADAGAAGPIVLGEVNYRAAGWYPNTAGIVDLPAGRTLSPNELGDALSKPLALMLKPAGGPAVVAASEHPDGVHVRADMFVARLNPGDDFKVNFTATKLGKPLGGARIDLSRGPAFLTNPGEPTAGVPATGLTVPASVTCDALGKATAAIHATAPGNPRGYIDGQVYRVNYELHGVGPLDRSDFLSVLAWDDFAPDEPPTWQGSMKKLFQQYANLYPVMLGFFDMGNYEDVSANRLEIIARLSVPQSDARYMPITRDLSEAKRLAMIRWLTNVGADGKPLLGTLPGPQPLVALTADGHDPIGKARVVDVHFRNSEKRDSTPS